MPRIRTATVGEHKALVRDQILRATETLIARSGTARINLADVAALVGIGRTTMYEYFRDRDDLIASLVEDTLPGVVERILGSLPRAGSEDRLLGLAVATVEFVATDPVLGLILHREVPKLSQTAQDRIRLCHENLINETASVFRRGVAEGVFRAMPPDLAGRLIQDSIMSAAKAVIAAPHPQRRLSEITQALTDFLMTGLGGNPRLP
jgi:AcrR family transcriptional regulator